MDTEHRFLPPSSHAAKREGLASILQALLEAGLTVVQAPDDEGNIISFTLVTGRRPGVVRRTQSVGHRDRGQPTCLAYLPGQDGTLRKYEVRMRRFRQDSWTRVDCPAHEADDLRRTLASSLQLVTA